MTIHATPRWWDIKKVHQTLWQGLNEYTRIIVWERVLNKVLNNRATTVYAYAFSSFDKVWEGNELHYRRTNTKVGTPILVTAPIPVCIHGTSIQVTLILGG